MILLPVDSVPMRTSVRRSILAQAVLTLRCCLNRAYSLLHHVWSSFAFFHSALLIYIAPLRKLSAAEACFISRRLSVKNARWGIDFELILIVQTLILILGCLQLILLIFWSLYSQKRTKVSLAASAISLSNTFILCTLSHLEHTRSVRPSTLLNLYLLFSSAFDAVQPKSLWLIGERLAICAVFSVSLAAKILILVLKAKEKRRLLRRSFRAYPPESLRGVFS